MEINVIYQDNKHTYFEEQVKKIAESYNGIILLDFERDPEGFGCLVKIPSKGQEDNFRRDVQHVANHLKLNITFGGFVSL